MSVNYSTKEQALFRFFGFSGPMLSTIPADRLYPMAAEKAFMDRTEGPEAESLRRCLVALNNRTVFRCTDEWDALISFGSRADIERDEVIAADLMDFESMMEQQKADYEDMERIYKERGKEHLVLPLLP